MMVTTSIKPAASDGPAPERRCIASGEVRAPAELLRFVLGPDGGLVFDPAGRLPGRGLWLSARRDMIEKACHRNLFARATRSAVRAPDGLVDQIEGSLRRRCLDLVGFARRAGQVVAGYEKVRSRLSAGRVRLLIHASDAAPGGKRKLDRLAVALAKRVEILELFSAAELGRVLGREAAVHVAVGPGGLAERLAVEAARLRGVMDLGRTTELNDRNT